MNEQTKIIGIDGARSTFVLHDSRMALPLAAEPERLMEVAKPCNDAALHQRGQGVKIAIMDHESKIGSGELKMRLLLLVGCEQNVLASRYDKSWYTRKRIHISS